MGNAQSKQFLFNIFASSNCWILSWTSLCKDWGMKNGNVLIRNSLVKFSFRNTLSVCPKDLRNLENAAQCHKNNWDNLEIFVLFKRDKSKSEALSSCLHNLRILSEAQTLCGCKGFLKSSHDIWYVNQSNK